MTGDSSDNIKGADKVGPKTAAYLLNQFKNLENIILNAEDIEKPSIKKSITENAERLRMNYKIIKLNNTASLPFSLDDIRYTLDETATNDVLKGIGLIE